MKNKIITLIIFLIIAIIFVLFTRESIKKEKEFCNLFDEYECTDYRCLRAKVDCLKFK